MIECDLSDIVSTLCLHQTVAKKRVLKTLLVFVQCHIWPLTLNAESVNILNTSWEEEAARTAIRQCAMLPLSLHERPKGASIHNITRKNMIRYTIPKHWIGFSGICRMLGAVCGWCLNTQSYWEWDKEMSTLRSVSEDVRVRALNLFSPDEEVHHLHCKTGGHWRTRSVLVFNLKWSSWRISR